MIIRKKYGFYDFVTNHTSKVPLKSPVANRLSMSLLAPNVPHLNELDLSISFIFLISPAFISNISMVPEPFGKEPSTINLAEHGIHLQSNSEWFKLFSIWVIIWGVFNSSMT